MAAAAERLPIHATIRCIDPMHRGQQHAQGVGTIIGGGEKFHLGNLKHRYYEVVWQGVEAVQRHDADTVMRVFSRKEAEKIRADSEQELERLRQDI